MPNVLTVDVEDYYHGALHIPTDSWSSYAPRLMTVFPRLLDWLDQVDLKATMFVLGPVAEAYPEIIRDASRRGHEIAAHGYSHTHLGLMTPDALREELRRTRALLEDITGQAVIGFRAPYFSITRKSLWVLPVLREMGFRYDSSIFPTRNPVYGIYSAPLAPYEITELSLVEFPPSTLALCGLRLPVAGGGYLRLLPAWFVRRALHRLARARGHTVFYMHPWELDGHQPRLYRNPFEYVLYGYGVKGFASKLTRVVRAMDFTSFRAGYFSGQPLALDRVSLSSL